MKVKRSNYFIPFKKDTDLQGPLARMVKGAFVHQQASGMYIWLPLGLRMLEKIINLVDKEHETIGAQKLLMPILQDANLWKQSNRYEGYGSEMLKIYDRHEREFIYGPSAEEVFTQLVTTWQINKNSFPLMLYNTQWKFRDEIRPRFGVVRSREFLMKDLYSFDKSEEEMMENYEKVFQVYSTIFNKLGLNVCTFSSDVGVMGGSMSHEFVIKSEFGETVIGYDKWPTQPLQWKDRDNVKMLHEKAEEGQEKYAELGHIYALGQRYSKEFKLLNPENQHPVFMGCYGIGISRLAAILFENHIHDLGVCAPFKYTLITIGQDEKVMQTAHEMFAKLNEVIWDDRDASYGIKCAEADLIGSNMQIHIGKKELENNKVIIKQNGIKQEIALDNLYALI